MRFVDGIDALLRRAVAAMVGVMRMAMREHTNDFLLSPGMPATRDRAG